MNTTDFEIIFEAIVCCELTHIKTDIPELKRKAYEYYEKVKHENSTEIYSSATSSVQIPKRQLA